MASKQQRAIFVHKLAQPMELGERPVPTPDAGQVLIKVTSTMLLPHDQKARDIGLFIGSKLPFILGANVAGTIEQLGPDVSSLSIGDAIFGLSNFFGPIPDQAGLQEYATLDIDAVAKIPSGFTPDQVASLPINLVTSWIALFGGEGAGLGFPPPFAPEASTFDYAAQTLVILAAGSSVGRFAVQLAALAGIGIIIAVAGPGSRDELLAMGATHFFSRHSPQDELVSHIHGLTGEEGATHVYHCHGRDWSLDTALLAHDKASALRSVHRMTPEQTARLHAERPLCDGKFVQCSMEGMAPYAREFWGSLPGWLVEGKVNPGKFRVIEGLEKVSEIDAALDEYRDGSGAGVQIVVHP